jgi:acetyl esterase/lipase
MFLAQAIVFFLLSRVHRFVALAGLAFIVLLCYGGGFGTMPAFAADFFGPRNVGTTSLPPAPAARSSSRTASEDLEVIPLRPRESPSLVNTNAQEKVFVAQDGTRFVQNVTEPSLTVFRPEGKANGTAVVICPGGGYHLLAIDYEGNDVARWLTSFGVTAFVLK